MRIAFQLLSLGLIAACASSDRQPSDPGPVERSAAGGDGPPLLDVRLDREAGTARVWLPAPDAAGEHVRLLHVEDLARPSQVTVELGEHRLRHPHVVGDVLEIEHALEAVLHHLLHHQIEAWNRREPLGGLRVPWVHELLRTKPGKCPQLALCRVGHDSS